MAISATLEARSTSILNGMENLARNANKGAHKLAKAMLNSYADRLEEFRINHDEEGFAVTLESANAECEKMRRVFKKNH